MVLRVADFLAKRADGDDALQNFDFAGELSDEAGQPGGQEKYDDADDGIRATELGEMGFCQAKTKPTRSKGVTTARA
jgi:hypothetical protein